MTTLDSVQIEVLNSLDQLSINPVVTELTIELATVDPTGLVKSVNGKTGDVVGTLISKKFYNC